MAWRYIAQRILTGEILDYDLPLITDGPAWALSGAGSLAAKISPDVGALRADDGELLLQEWGTAIYAEVDGVIGWGGILISSDFADEEWSIEAAGFSTYPHGIPYQGDYQHIDIDPVAAFRELWRHVQDHPDGNLGLEINAPDTPVRIGTGARLKLKIDVDPLILQLLHPWIPEWLEYGVEVPVRDLLPWLPPDWEIAFPEDPLPIIKDFVKNVLPDEYKDLAEIPKELTFVKADPYALVWWEATDAGTEIDNLAKATPFDYIERHFWDGDKIRHTLDVAYPRHGRRREDLRFVQGDNVSKVVSFKATGDDYANEILGIGAGEGRSVVHRSTAVRDGRLRRVAVYTDKAVRNDGRLDSLIRDELENRSGLLDIDSIDVIDHPNAPIGSWELGDDVLVSADVPWLGEVDLWCRVVGWKLTGDHTATLTLARSDSFHYGGTEDGS